MKTRIHGLLAAGLALALAACASTTLRDSWVDPAWHGASFRKMLVLTVSDNATNRRIVEDAVAARIAAVGVEAVPSYQLLPGDSKAPEPVLDDAVRRAGADSLLMVRLRRVETRTNISTMMVPGPMYGAGWYGWYNAWYAMPTVSQYDLVTVETTLFDVATKRIVWAGTTETVAPVSVQKEAPVFADVVVKALGERRMLPVKG